jgi:hypothetical protein
VDDENALTGLTIGDRIQHDIADVMLTTRTHHQKIATLIGRFHRIARYPHQLRGTTEPHRPEPDDGGDHDDQQRRRDHL